MSLTIAVDFDEVLAESMRACLRYYDNKIAGQDIQYETLFAYHLEDNDHLDIQAHEAVERFDSFMRQGHDAVQPVDGAYEILSQLKDAGHTLIIVTARPEHLRNQTEKRLSHYYPDIFHGIEFGNIYTGGTKRTKAQMCQSIGADILIDDNLPYCRDVAQSHPHMTVYLYDRPWNRDYDIHSHKSIKKISHWHEMTRDIFSE